MSGQNNPKVNFPGAPVTQNAMNQMQSNIGQYGPQMGEFYSKMMNTGGRTGVNQIMDSQAKVYQNMVDQIKAQAGLLPRGSGQSRYLGEALGQATNQYNLQQQQNLLDQEQQVISNQFAGAQGLGALPSYYGQPSAFELQMLGLQQPYDLANQQSAMNNQALQASLLASLLQPTPMDYTVTPSQAEQMLGWLAPLLSGLGQGFATGYPTFMSGGNNGNI